MPPLSKIIKYGLESRARELYDNDISFSEIALVLSNESGQNITKAMTFQYLSSEARCNAAVIEKKAQLQVAIVEAEISTIEDRQSVIRGLLQIATTSEDERNRIVAYKTATEALDSLDKRLGRLSANQQNLTINNFNAMKLEQIPTDELLRMAYAARSSVQ